MWGGMTRARKRPDFLRARKPHEHARVTNIELFFDLVFVFAVTQLSHALLHDLTGLGVLHTLLLFMAVWWVWIYTSWVTNWLDPEQTAVRLLLLVLMLAGLVLSTSLPEAFAGRGLAFAGAYVFMQVGRSLFTLWAIGRQNHGLFRNFQRITAWLALAGAFWIGGGFAEDGVRLALWAAALLVEYLSPAAGFWTPGLGRSRTSDWNVEGGHMAERCSLFVIIALGESIVVTGATFSGLDWTPGTAAAFAIAFAGTVAMWWIYFDRGAERGSRHIAGAADPGRLARLAYTYLHLPIVAGIIVGAVADDLVLAHATGHADGAATAVILAAPALYLLGNTLFKWTIAGRPPPSHLIGLALLVLLAALGWPLPPLALAAGATFALIVTAAWETISLGRGAAAREP
jgi:low temperature requirement protein LtrA